MRDLDPEQRAKAQKRALLEELLRKRSGPATSAKPGSRPAP